MQAKFMVCLLAASLCTFSVMRAGQGEGADDKFSSAAERLLQIPAAFRNKIGSESAGFPGGMQGSKIAVSHNKDQSVVVVGSEADEKERTASGYVSGEGSESDRKCFSGLVYVAHKKLTWYPRECIENPNKYSSVSCETILKEMDRESFFRIYEALPQWYKAQGKSLKEIVELYPDGESPAQVKCTAEPGADHTLRINVSSPAYALWMMPNIVVPAFEKANSEERSFTLACMNACARDGVFGLPDMYRKNWKNFLAAAIEKQK